jgi:predicted nucleotidyltransferase
MLPIGRLMRMDSDEVEVLRSFVACGVRFLVIGGRAVQFHGRFRPAKDLDLLVEFSAINWEKLGWALRPLNASVPPFDTLSEEKRYQAKLAFYPTVEFLTSIDGVPFEQAWADAVETIVDGVRVRVLSKAHLITSKQSSTRPLDASDITALRGIP